MTNFTRMTLGMCCAASARAVAGMDLCCHLGAEWGPRFCSASVDMGARRTAVCRVVFLCVAQRRGANRSVRICNTCLAMVSGKAQAVASIVESVDGGSKARFCIVGRWKNRGSRKLCRGIGHRFGFLCAICQGRGGARSQPRFRRSQTRQFWSTCSSTFRPVLRRPRWQVWRAVLWRRKKAAKPQA